MELWDCMKSLEGQTLKTLDRGHSFVVLDVSEQVVIVKPLQTKKERPITRREIEGAYHELQALGHISRNSIEERHSPRNPVYVAALLAKLEGVIFSVRPIELKLRRLKN